MYTALEAIVKYKDSAIRQYRRLSSQEISNYAVSDIFDDFTEAYISLDHESFSKPKVLDLYKLRNDYLLYQGTLSALLEELSDISLPYVEGSLEVNTKYLKFTDAFLANFKITPVTQTGSLDDPTPMDERDWIVLQKEGFDYNLATKHFLVSINGFLHFTESSSQGIFVKDAMKTNRQSNESTCGILDFSDIGEIQLVPITEDMVFEYAENELSDKALLTSPVSFENKTVLMSIGGYLVLPNTRAFTEISSHDLLIDFKNYSLINRHIQSREYISFENFNLTKFERNSKMVEVNEILSDSYIKNLLTMSQSFFIILDTPKVEMDMVHLRKNRMPGTYTSYIKPIYPLISTGGRIGNYWPQYQKPYWSVNIVDGLTNNRLYHTRAYKELSYLDDKNHSFLPRTFDRAYYLKLYSQELGF